MNVNLPITVGSSFPSSKQPLKLINILAEIKLQFSCITSDNMKDDCTINNNCKYMYWFTNG